MMKTKSSSLMLLIYIFSLQNCYAWGSPIQLNLFWNLDLPENRTEQCIGFFDLFLKELREISGEKKIEIKSELNRSMLPDSAVSIEVLCELQNTNTGQSHISLKVKNLKNPEVAVLVLKKDEQHNQVDPSDWPQFQKQYLRSALAEPNLKLSAISKQTTVPSFISNLKNEGFTPNLDTTPVYRKWWFWTIMGGVVASSVGAYILSSSAQSSSESNIEFR